MSAIQGKDMRLHIGNAATPVESFLPLGNLTVTQFDISHTAMDASHAGSGAWQRLSSQAGLKSMQMSAEGISHHSAAEEMLRQIALSGELRHFRLTFGQGGILQGPCLVTAYQHGGQMQDAQRIAFTLQSAGVITYSAL